jgi:hypothetical protein
VGIASREMLRTTALVRAIDISKEASATVAPKLTFAQVPTKPSVRVGGCSIRPSAYQAQCWVGNVPFAQVPTKPIVRVEDVPFAQVPTKPIIRVEDVPFAQVPTKPSVGSGMFHSPKCLPSPLFGSGMFHSPKCLPSPVFRSGMLPLFREKGKVVVVMSALIPGRRESLTHRSNCRPLSRLCALGCDIVSAVAGWLMFRQSDRAEDPRMLLSVFIPSV